MHAEWGLPIAAHPFGVPEVADTYQTVPVAARWLTQAEAQLAFRPANAKFVQMRWWQQGLDPTLLSHSLREPAEVIAGCVAAYRAGLADRESSLRIALDAAEFLIWAQGQAGTGVFPFPAARGNRDSSAFASAEHYFAKAQREGRLNEVVRNGWAIDDAGNGGLQFDNGEAGSAMLALYELTRDPKHLASARKAADWALARPLVANWNYNAFSVQLLAKAFAVTGDEQYLRAAKRKALLGVIPGQLTDGPLAGRWGDAHNARPEYHYIIMLALSELSAAMPNADSERNAIVRSLQLGLRARNQDFISRGAPTKNAALIALLHINRQFASDGAFLDNTLSTQALDALGKLVSAQYRRGNDPVGPRAWGRFLEFVVWKAAAFPTRP